MSVKDMVDTLSDMCQGHILDLDKAIETIQGLVIEDYGQALDDQKELLAICREIEAECQKPFGKKGD